MATVIDEIAPATAADTSIVAALRGRLTAKDLQTADLKAACLRERQQTIATLHGLLGKLHNETQLADSQRSYRLPMKTGVRAVLLAISLAGVAAPATLIAGAALPGHLVTPWWVPSQPQIQAVPLPNVCYFAARHYRDDFNYEPPPGCWNSSWFQSSDGHWDRPMPFGREGQRPPPGEPGNAPPSPPPPGDVPLPPSP